MRLRRAGARREGEGKETTFAAESHTSSHVKVGPRAPDIPPDAGAARGVAPRVALARVSHPEARAPKSGHQFALKKYHLPLDDDDLDMWERFDAWRAPLEEDDADCRAKHRTDTDRIEDVYSMFDQVVNDLRSPPSSQQQHQLTNNQTVLRDATARAQKLLGIEFVLKGMSNDLEQCLDDDVTLRSAKNHLAKISEIVSRKMNQQLG